MGRYVKLPVEIEAVQFTGYNAKDLQDWVDAAAVGLESDEKGFINTFIICTLEGDMTARVGDWIIKGVAGEFYPCNDQIFRTSYSPADQVTEPSYHYHDTLDKVRDALGGLMLYRLNDRLNDEEITELISMMQMKGILFRERKREDADQPEA